jgi:hypothetical protein
MDTESISLVVCRLQEGSLMPNLSLNPDASPAALRAVRSAPVIGSLAGC